ncbi:uncharacterized protein LOC132066519 [Lycium ferocissimum]|uniref:uncharacterized protein LOC132066519 n=1 Tax=Lycium ferocissimum TaxID=112874 RepID=UPI0028167E7D|nr:uncharacterized protein LOC132066519 [Lycium ferocissimum]
MANEAVKFYHKQFTQEEMGHTNEDILQHIPYLLDQESNEMLCKVPSNEEVKAAVFNLSGSSASGPDGFSVLFYQVYWSIVEADVIRMVLAFFQGDTLPKLEKVLPTLISPHQAGFVKGRSIIENVLLTQEIVTDIRKRGKPANLVLKLDMAKAYDRVSWSFLTKVLNQMGFSEGFIDKIWRLIAKNWYSILFNGKARGFFHSTRGVKQGDPLSPALFILIAEVLSRALNSLHDNNDTIIFASAERNSLKMVMDILRDYEAISGQLINIEKSAFYMYHKVADRMMQNVRIVTGFTKGQFPFNYLGCPIFHARKKKVYYQDLIKKVKDKLRVGRSNKKEDKSKHWVSWKKICMPKAEGGLGFRSLFDISKALFAKLWWRFRTSNSLWSTFLWNKYCKKLKPTKVQWKGGSQVWKKMLEARDQMDHFIWWEPRSGSCDSWEDNWTRLGPLREVSSSDHNLEEVAELMDSEGWDLQKMNVVLPKQVVNHVKSELSIMGKSTDADVPWWNSTNSGKFTVGSAWNLMRQQEQESLNYQRIWSKGVPFKISFFLWRMWKAKIPVDDVLKRMNISIVSRCRCCLNSQSEETMQHLFLTGNCAAEVWQYYTTAAGIIDPLIQLHQAVVKWWNMKCAIKLKQDFEAMPSFICWQL